ncbi:long-chain-fatty-acid--CoA ligase 5-like [Centruroides sculpturatus]|uniref:long-chain-fatty-acid--CoA ligase 5-like n=1 Tax=Centruroides sculpturatus TaxID=218467 RepID=UPI000C6CDB53|nr:long-chain-fatty-acid--CoA ligase 5-like [Centruroides sculpturatus]
MSASIIVRRLIRIPKYFHKIIPLWDIKYVSTTSYIQNTILSSPKDIQSVILPGPERIRASTLLKDPYELLRYCDNFCTVYETWHYGLKLSGDGDCLGTYSKETKQYEWIKYSEVIKRGEYLGSALISLGLKPKNDSFVGIYSKNRNEFVMSNLGCITYSMVPVPLYDTLGKDSLHFIINQVELPIVICDSVERASTLLEEKDKIPTLKSIVVMDEVNDDVKLKAHAKGISLFLYSEFEELGRNKILKPVPPKPEDLYVISYTSGTTGSPKGVLITHSNIVSCLAAIKVASGAAYNDGKKFLSYLPAAHVYEIVNQLTIVHKGGKIGFYSGDIKNVLDDILRFQPTMLPLVPRIMNRLYSIIMDDMKKNPVKRYFWNIALKRKESLLKRGILRNDTIWDKLFFDKLIRDLGGNAAVISSTSAPISPEVIRFFRLASGCQVSFYFQR